jgi:serine/threonine protein kinase
VLYELVTGRQPFGGDDLIAVMQSILMAAPPPLLVPWKHPARDLERVIHKMLAKVPQNRYASVTEVGAELQRLQTSQTSQKIWHQRKFRYFILTVIIIFLIVGLNIGWIHFGDYLKKEKFLPPTSLKMYSIGTTSEIDGTPSFSPDGKKVLFSTRTIGLPVN